MNNVSSAYTPPFYGKPPLRTSPARFLQGNLDLSFYDFSKIPTLLRGEVGGGEVGEGVHPMNVSSGNNTNTLTSRERNLN